MMNTFRSCASKCRTKIRQDINLRKIFIKEYGTKFREKEGTVRALEHFDDLYKGIFKRKWPSIRLGLLSQSKHVALLNNLGDLETSEELLKNTGALNLKLFLRPDETDLVEFESGQLNSELLQEHEDEMKHEVLETKEVLKASYPEGCEYNVEKHLKDYELEFDDDNDDKLVKKNELVGSAESMSDALNKSQIDTSRLIDPSVGLDPLYEFLPVSEMKRESDYIPEEDYFRFYKVNSEFPVNIEKEQDLCFPDQLKVYSFPRGDISTFPAPKKCLNGVYNYYPLDGASILVVLALGLQAGDKVLDMCAAPGGKSLIILQTMMPEYLVCNDSSLSRCNRLLRVLEQYLPNFPDMWRDNVSVTNKKGEIYVNTHKFNKILVDVPCTSDRHSATVSENNIFHVKRIKERLKLPEYQAQILENALKIVEPGGTVVYSTCTLSPVQNDGVVNLALQKIWNECRMEFTIRDLSPALNKFKTFYSFAETTSLKYGSLVFPFVPLNFGPMYFCKIVKNK